MEPVESLLLDSARVRYLFALVCFLVAALAVTKWIIRGKQRSRRLDAFPGPPGHWLMGHVNQFKQDGTDLDKVVEWGLKYPLAFPLCFGPFLPVLFIHHPDYIKTILASTEPKDDVAYRFLIPWIGDGLLVSSGQKWFLHRRLLTPGFHYNILKPYVKLMSDSAQVMLDKWESFAKTNQLFELFEHASLMTLDTIMKCAFSCNCQTESGSDDYIRAVYELSHLINLRFRTFPYHNDMIFHLSPHGYRFRRACAVAHRHTEEVIRKRRAALKEADLDVIRAKRNIDFLDILLCARDEEHKGLSDEAIRAEVDTFMFEGHDTTASGISFTLYCLACHPTHQQACREEVHQALGDRDSIEWEDLNKIPYTTMCIKECLRLYPPVPGIARKITKPMTFFDGRSVPEGCIVGTTVYGLHRNSTVWENPHAFDPLRFLPENVSKRSPHAFVPFSAGPRNCIGQNFALNEMKVVVAQTLRRYQLMEEPSRRPKVIPKLVLRSINGIHIRIKPVEQKHQEKTRSSSS